MQKKVLKEGGDKGNNFPTKKSNVIFLLTFIIFILALFTIFIFRIAAAPPIGITWFYADPPSISPGGSSTLSWNTYGMIACSIPTLASGTSGSTTVSPTSTTTYTLTCWDSAEGYYTASTTVTVSIAGSISLSANPTSINSGSSSNLTWTSSGVTSCTKSGGWSGSASTSGTQSVSPTSNTIYNLTCQAATYTTSNGYVCIYTEYWCGGVDPRDDTYCGTFSPQACDDPKCVIKEGDVVRSSASCNAGDTEASSTLQNCFGENVKSSVTCYKSASASATVTVTPITTHYTLHIEIFGAGGVWDSVSGFNCSSPSCTWSLPVNQKVILNTNPLGGTFDGACSGITSCSFFMTGPRWVDVTFPASPVVSVSPSFYNYGTVTVGSSSSHSFTVNNTGGGTLSGTASMRAPFSCTDCSYSLSAGASKSVPITFTPTSTGTFSRTATFSNSGGSNVTVQLTGTGQESPTTVPSCSASPTSINVTQSVTFSLNVTPPNDGNCLLDYVAYGDVQDFSSGLCSTFTTRTHTYNSVGTYSPTFSTLSPSASAPCGTITVSNPQLPAATISVSDDLDYGPVTVGYTKDLKFTVRNVGGGTLTGSASVSSPFFCVSGCNYSALTTFSQDFFVTIRFSPPSAQSYSRTVTFTGGGGAIRTVTGQGVALPNVSLTANPSTITSGSSSKLSWTFSGASSPCTKSGGTFTGTTSTSPGNQSVSPTSTTNYKLTCYNLAGSSAFDSAKVTVAGGGPGCGNGVIEGTEQCDDGNTANGDGCSSSCLVEDGWTCNNQPSVCVKIDQCLNKNFCSDYTSQAQCNADACNVADNEITGSCPSGNITRLCSWNSTSGTCGPSYTCTNSSGGSGSCQVTQNTTDDCSDGFLSYSWTGIWTGQEIEPDASQCRAGGAGSHACPALVQLPFFSTYNVIAIIVLALLIYLIISMRKKLGSKRKR